MTSDEIRLAALEKLVQAIAPWLTEDALADAAATLRSDLVAAHDHQARIVLKQALLLLAHGAARSGTEPSAMWLQAAFREASAK